MADSEDEEKVERDGEYLTKKSRKEKYVPLERLFTDHNSRATKGS